MSAWDQFPTLYEINTWVWLAELCRKAGKQLTLSSVPAGEWDAIAAYGFDAIWLMGVWERSPAGIAIANQNNGLLEEFRSVIPDFQIEDNVGSPYCIRRYVVDPHLGGSKGLAVARKEISKRGMRLMLDFVPNHVAPDHPWVREHPEYFIRGTEQDVKDDAVSFIQIEDTVFARGRDPYFPAWPDVLQLNAFDTGLRMDATHTLLDIASQCDGVRCDMSMLVANPVFEKTWGVRAGSKPETEYWRVAISAVKESHPDFLFIAETYWDLEWELQQQGFDFCYDKRLYDRLEHDTAESVRLHLCADAAYQDKLLRFIENHDEPRAASVFSPARERAAAVATFTLTGARLFHEGQFEGRKVRLPVFLGRRPEQVADIEMQEFYRRLLSAIDHPLFHEGNWSLCERSGWINNQTCQNIVAWRWHKDEAHKLIVVNLSDSPSQALVNIGRDEIKGKTWTLTDMLSSSVYERSGDELQESGLYVDMGPWNYYLFDCRETVSLEPTAKAQQESRTLSLAVST